jgi:predicted AAA+ superfamily ATPase
MDIKVVLESIKQSGLPEAVNRDFVVPKPAARKIVAIVGPRRAGKTYLLYQIAKARGDWYFINFEDERLDLSTSLLGEVCAYVSGKAGNIFLDEIDKLQKWDVALRRVSDDYRDLDFFVSSSSEELAYASLPSALRGRVLSYELLPLSFREYLMFRGVKAELRDERTVAAIKALLEEYLLFGGFPEVALETNRLTKIDLLNSYFETTVTLDIAEKFGLDHKLVHYVARMLRKRSYYSANKMLELFKTAGFRVGKETALRMESSFAQAYYAAFVEIFSKRAKDALQYPRKPYLFDTGFVAFGIGENWWRLYENAVYLHIRRDKKAGEEVNYWKSADGYEVDFVVREGEKVGKLVQVCYDIENEDTKKRELRGLVKAAKEFGVTECTIVTKDFKGEEGMDGARVTYVPLWEYLLSA